MAELNGGSHVELALVCVAPRMVPDVWPLVSQWIDDAYAVMDLPTPDVRAWLVAEKGLLWVAIRDDKPIAAMTSSLVPTRSGLALRMVAAGGYNLTLWKAFAQQIEDYAAAEGCYKVYFEGRLGWQKAMPGYVASSVTLEKRI